MAMEYRSFPPRYDNTYNPAPNSRHGVPVRETILADGRGVFRELNQKFREQ